MYRGSVSARNIVRGTESEKKFDKSASYSNVLRPTGSLKDKHNDTTVSDDISASEQSDEILAIEEEADKELDAFIAEMENMKEEEVQAMLESAEEELSVDSSVTPPVKNSEDEVMNVDSKGDIEVIAEADEKKEEPVEEKVDEPEPEPELVVEEKEEEPESFQEFCFRDIVSKG